MIVTLYRAIFRKVYRRGMVKEIYRQLFAIEVEKEFHRRRYGFFVTDHYSDQIILLKSILTQDEKEHYDVFWRNHATHKFYKHVEHKIPDYIRKQTLDDHSRYQHYNLGRIVEIYTRSEKCLEDMREILKQL